jgi:hypothetical protein
MLRLGSVLGRWVARLVPLVVAIWFISFCTRLVHLKSVKDPLSGILLLAAILVLGVVAGFAAERLLAPLLSSFTPAPPPPATVIDDSEQIRDRLAVNVVTTGAIAIASLAALLLLLIGYYDKQDNGKALTTTGMNVFTTVLPVLATWVGTVLAFYFTKESFRQAAQSTKDLMATQDDDTTLIVDSPAVMVAYDKITKVVLTAAQVTAEGGDLLKAAQARTAAADTLKSMFGDTVTRVIVFGPDRAPLYVIRAKRVTNGMTVGSYLDDPANLADARLMHGIGAQATLSDGRRVLKLYNVVDLFVTQNGTLTEPAIGWVPDDHLA